jgi:DNA invertase Pin-like site-specific DNA recombinase
MTPKVTGYCRVSTAEQAASGYSLRAQEHAIRDAVKRRGWELGEVVRDEGASGKSMDRPGLIAALQAIAAGKSAGLVVSKLDRLSRSVVDFGSLLDWMAEAEATLVALDYDLDTSTPNGRMVATIIMAVAEWERETIALRTSVGLTAARGEGKPIGPPSVADRPELAKRIQRLRDRGLSLRAIADELNRAGVPTLRGGAEWRPSSIERILGYVRPRRRRRPSVLPSLNGHQEPDPARTAR